MEVVYCRVMLRVACCYRTVSYDAVAVVCGMQPFALLAEERQKIYGGILKSVARDQLTSRWQTAWENAANGRWTYCLIKDLVPWLRRQHGEVSFHLSQVLTGHGCFCEYLHPSGKPTATAVLCAGRLQTILNTQYSTATLFTTGEPKRVYTLASTSSRLTI
ncbi:uncharacterized protein LOC132952728 [Metopolophium dirhodum]|uniref:uncharacterized protein LOC132952728 n=1 Tax=Metopolophium dirhodum TaxID=44670 RepID=UPI00298F8CDD|nr:uncharacterized protein LOC132952728 [Metopolophium dirhodum]